MAFWYGLLAFFFFEGIRTKLTITNNFSKSEVHQLYVAPRIKQDIFGLQISIHDAVAVEEDKDHGDFRSIELRRCKIKAARSSQIAENLSTCL